jgi:acetoin utilization deacetylase AcuC-like enzyme
MKFILSGKNSSHNTGDHPENNGRLSLITGFDVYNGPVTESLVHLFHTPDYVARVKSFCQAGGGQLDPDTVVSPGSYEAALEAVAVAVASSEHGDFALVRPPGHHAFPDRSGGFCIFNNMAIAAERLTKEGKKVFILDIDGHLGDGTERFFYERCDVFYASLHQEGSFPGGGRHTDIGYGSGLGFTVNLPIPPGSGDDIFTKGLERILMIADQFQPDFVGVSAGFDGHNSDKLLFLNLSAAVFHLVGNKLCGRYPNLFAVLEGGYNPEAVKNCAENLVAGVNGQPLLHPETTTETMLIELESFDTMMSEQKEVLKPYWKL